MIHACADGRPVICGDGKPQGCDSGCPPLSTDWISRPDFLLCGGPAIPPGETGWLGSLGTLPANKHFLLTFEVETDLLQGNTAQYTNIHDCGVMFPAMTGLNYSEGTVLSVKRNWQYTNPCGISVVGSGTHYAKHILSTGSSAKELTYGWNISQTQYKDYTDPRFRLMSCEIFPHPPVINTLNELRELIGSGITVTSARSRTEANLGLILDFSSNPNADCFWTDHIFYATRIWPLAIVRNEVWKPSSSTVLEIYASEIITNGRIPGSTNPPVPEFRFVPEITRIPLNVPPEQFTFPLSFGDALSPTPTIPPGANYHNCGIYPYYSRWYRNNATPATQYSTLAIVAPKLVPGERNYGYCETQSITITDARHAPI